MQECLQKLLIGLTLFFFSYLRMLFFKNKFIVRVLLILHALLMLHLLHPCAGLVRFIAHAIQMDLVSANTGNRMYLNHPPA